MGTEQIFPIGTILTRRNPQEDAWDEVRVTGTAASSVVVTSNTEFTETRTLDVMTAREDYDGDIPEREGDGEEGKVIMVNPGLTPEQIFAKQARADKEAGIEPPKVRQGRKRSDPPAPVRQGGE